MDARNHQIEGQSRDVRQQGFDEVFALQAPLRRSGAMNAHQQRRAQANAEHHEDGKRSLAAGRDQAPVCPGEELAYPLAGMAWPGAEIAPTCCSNPIPSCRP